MGVVPYEVSRDTAHFLRGEEKRGILRSHKPKPNDAGSVWRRKKEGADMELPALNRNPPETEWSELLQTNEYIT